MVADPAVVPAVYHGFTATEIILIISAVSGAITTIISTLRNGVKTDKVIEAVVGSPKKEGLVDEVSKIHALTNNTLTQTKQELQRAQELNTALQNMILELKTERTKKELIAAYQSVPPELENTIVKLKAEVEELKKK